MRQKKVKMTSHFEPLILSPAKILAESSSSGFGISYWSSLLNCGMKQKLRQEHPGVTLLNTPGEKINMMHVGVFFHKLRELWRLGLLLPEENGSFHEDKVIIEWGDFTEPDEWKEALRLFRFYISQFERSEWTTVSCEELFEFGCRECAKLLPCSQALAESRACVRSEYDDGVLCSMAKTTINVFGVPCISGRYDEVAHIDEVQKEALISKRMLPLFDSGIYIVDAKTSGQRWGNIDKQYEHSQQFTLYQMAWSLKNPDRPAQGMIADGLWAYKKEPRTESFLIRNTKHKEAVLKSFLSKCWRNFLQNGYETNPARCNDYGQSCIWEERGLCDKL